MRGRAVLPTCPPEGPPRPPRTPAPLPSAGALLPPPYPSCPAVRGTADKYKHCVFKLYPMVVCHVHYAVQAPRGPADGLVCPWRSGRCPPCRRGCGENTSGLPPPGSGLLAQPRSRQPPRPRQVPESVPLTSASRSPQSHARPCGWDSSVLGPAGRGDLRCESLTFTVPAGPSVPSQTAGFSSSSRMNNAPSCVCTPRLPRASVRPSVRAHSASRLGS